MAKTTEYKVLQGIDYPPNKRAEAGDIVSDLPKESISWLISSGVIERIGKESAPEVEEVVAAVIEALEQDGDLSEVDNGL
jgi:hypothetical protein